mmetsp:Transcript_76258/g.150830  ORF Transcript_76258/g.150830 Transcript_76258/m.150830 type:complete len:106 (+) Transcript_76258:77-394(+)
MGSSNSSELRETMEKVSAGDDNAVDKAWALLDKDKSGFLEGAEHQKCLASCSDQILENWSTLDPAIKKHMLQAMVPGYVKHVLDPEDEGKITKDAFFSKVLTIFS